MNFETTVVKNHAFLVNQKSNQENSSKSSLSLFKVVYCWTNLSESNLATSIPSYVPQSFYIEKIH